MGEASSRVRGDHRVSAIQATEARLPISISHHGSQPGHSYTSLRFSQRLSADLLVLDLCEDERGFGDVAYLGRADSDVLKGAPAFLQEGEPAFALVAQAAQQYVAAFRVGIEIAFAGLFDRDEDSGAGALVAGIGEAGKGFQPGPQAGQDELAGGGGVVGAAGQGAGGPPRDAVR